MIEAKIAEYMGGDAYEGARRACAEVHALPLYLDWTGCLAIRPDGKVIFIDDESYEVREVQDEGGGEPPRAPQPPRPDRLHPLWDRDLDG